MNCFSSRTLRLWLCAGLALTVAGTAGCPSGSTTNGDVTDGGPDGTQSRTDGASDSGAFDGSVDAADDGLDSSSGSGSGSGSGSSSGSDSGADSDLDAGNDTVLEASTDAAGDAGMGATACTGNSECASGECGFGTCAYISYADAVQNGNQPFTGSLGMDFVVAANTSITVTAMGAFDDLANTGLGSITVGIFKTSSQTLVSGTQLTITPATDNTVTLIGGDYFKELPSAVTLSGGATSTTYTVVAVGYGNNYLDGNNGVPGWTLSTDSTGGGKISFTGTARWAPSNGGFVWPTVVDTGPANRYGAGTFLFY